MPDGVLANLEPQQLEGPFSEYLREPLRREQTQTPGPPSGWAGLAGNLAGIADRFIGGMHQGRVLRYVQDEMQRGKQISGLLARADQIASDETATPDTRNKARAWASQLRLRLMEADDKGKGKGKKKDETLREGADAALHTFGGAIKGFAMALAGGNIPKSMGPLDTKELHSLRGELEEMVGAPEAKISYWQDKFMQTYAQVREELQKSGKPIDQVSISSDPRIANALLPFRDQIPAAIQQTLRGQYTPTEAMEKQFEQEYSRAHYGAQPAAGPSATTTAPPGAAQAGPPSPGATTGPAAAAGAAPGAPSPGAAPPDKLDLSKVGLMNDFERRRTKTDAVKSEEHSVDGKNKTLLHVQSDWVGLGVKAGYYDPITGERIEAGRLAKPVTERQTTKQEEENERVQDYMLTLQVDEKTARQLVAEDRQAERTENLAGKKAMRESREAAAASAKSLTKERDEKVKQLRNTTAMSAAQARDFNARTKTDLKMLDVLRDSLKLPTNLDASRQAQIQQQMEAIDQRVENIRKEIMGAKAGGSTVAPPASRMTGRALLAEPD